MVRRCRRAKTVKSELKHRPPHMLVRGAFCVVRAACVLRACCGGVRAGADADMRRVVRRLGVHRKKRPGGKGTVGPERKRKRKEEGVQLWIVQLWLWGFESASSADWPWRVICDLAAAFRLTTMSKPAWLGDFEGFAWMLPKCFLKVFWSTGEVTWRGFGHGERVWSRGAPRSL